LSQSMIKTLLLLMLTALVGCAAPSAPYTEVKQGPVKPATSERVKACDYLDDVIGSSGWYGVLATQGAENARAEAITKAAKIGATHIVWQSNTVAYGSTSVAGKAYRCAD
jgi:hypothetical protein